MNVIYKELTDDEEFLQLIPLAQSLVETQYLPMKVGGERAISTFLKEFILNNKGYCAVAKEEEAGMIGWIGGEIIPYQFSEEDIFQIRAWDVHPNYRGQSVGGILLAMAVKWAKEHNIRIVTVGVNVDSSNVPELAFGKLEKIGFKEFERTFYVKLED